ncbi:MAG: hypothetical protein HKL99_08305, partial [Burkholderiales bacterium]|nr:hypothetical protein [Burkholderiales bacterium]
MHQPQTVARLAASLSWRRGVSILLRLAASAALTLALAACGGGGGGGAPASYRVSGSLTGMRAGASMVLLVNGQALTLSQNGGFTTTAALPTGTGYSVTLGTQPAGEVCVVSNGAGVIGATNVIDVAVACTVNPQAAYTVGGTVSGLQGTLQLADNGHDVLVLASNGAFTFAQALFDKAAYSVTVSTQPAGQTCTVTQGAGTMQGADVTSVSVTCVTPPPAPTSSLGGTVTGLTGTVALSLNGGPSMTVSANGPYTFPAALASGAAYAVTVTTQPAGQTCSVVNGAGTVGSGNVTNADVICAANTYSIGGTLSGLTTGTGLAVVLQDNGGDDLTLTGNGSFTFATQIATTAPYSVTVKTQPSGQTCTVTNGAGTVGTAQVLNVSVICTRQTVSFANPGPALWTVPAGVTSIRIVATGGAGGGDNDQYGHGEGGNGAVVTTTLTVAPGQVLNLVVGGGGAQGGGAGLSLGVTNYGGGAGGGSTNVDAGTAAQIIAGGGGGGYADGTTTYNTGGNGCGNGFAGGNGQDSEVMDTPGNGGANGIGGTGSQSAVGPSSNGMNGRGGDGGPGGFGGPNLLGGSGGIGAGPG